MSTKLYTLADLIEVLSSTRQKVHDWSQRSKDLYVEPDYIAGRANQQGKCLINLWSEGQLDEIVENFSKFEEKKAIYNKNRKLKSENLSAYEKKRAEDMRRFRATYRKKKKAEVITAETITDEVDDKDREERAMQFLISRGLV